MSSFQLGKILKYPPFSSRSPSVEHDLRILKREKSKNWHHLQCTHECLSSQWFKTVPRPLPRSAAERLIYEVSCENSSCAMVESVAKIIQEMLLPLWIWYSTSWDLWKNPETKWFGMTFPTIPYAAKHLPATLKSATRPKAADSFESWDEGDWDVDIIPGYLEFS